MKKETHQDMSIVRLLARESHAPIEPVAQLCKHELAGLKVDAGIPSFLSILTIRKDTEVQP